jgi:hypothetical protein
MAVGSAGESAVALGFATKFATKKDCRGWSCVAKVITQLLHRWDFVIKETRQPRGKIVTPRDPRLPETPYLYRNRAFSFIP